MRIFNFTKYKNIYSAILIFLLSIPLIVPFFHSGYFPTHDGLWAVVRLGEMFRELKDHQFPPRWSGVLNFGYGYPLFNFAYPFPYYLGVFIHFFHIPFIATTKLLFALTVPLSGLGMFFVSKKILANSFAGFLSSILYMYLPYRMVDLYVRGSIGESVTLAIVPFLLWCLIVAGEKRSFFTLSIGSVLVGVLITSHNIMGLVFTPLTFLFALFLRWENKKSPINLLWIFLLGLGISAFFWLPAITEKQWIYLAKIPIADRTINFTSWQQLFVSPWQYGVPGSKESFTFQLGWGQILAIFAVIILITNRVMRRDKISLFVWVMLVSLVVLISLLFSFTNPIWTHIPFLKEINYPWTLLAPIGFVMSLLGGYIAIAKEKILRFLLFVALIAIAQAVFFAKPQRYIFQPDSYFLTNDANTTSSSEYTPLWVKQFPLKSPEKRVIMNGKGNITSENFTSNKFAFSVNAEKAAQITVNMIYYPGWKIMVDNQISPISYNNQYGVMQIIIPKGEHVVKGKFIETPLRLFADVISLLSLLFLTLFVLKKLVKIKKL